MPRLTAGIVGIAVAIALAVVLLLWGPASCRDKHALKKQNEVSAEQGNASIHAGQEAANITSEVQANAAATDHSVAEGQAAIRAAPEGQKGKATRGALCSMRTYRDTPQCKEPVK